MKKATTKSLRDFIFERFVLDDTIGPFIPGTETDRLMKELMTEFEGIYCGVYPDKIAGRFFIVKSAKSGKTFCQVRVK